MIIETHPYDFSQRELFRLTLRAYFVRQGWGYLVAAVFIIGLTILNGRSLFSIVLLTIFAALVLMGIPFYFVWRYAHHPSRQAFLGRRRCQFNADGLRFFSDKGTASLAWRDVPYVARTADYYLFFVDKMQFFYVPFAAFKTVADREHIDHYLQQRKYI